MFSPKTNSTHANTSPEESIIRLRNKNIHNSLRNHLVSIDITRQRKGTGGRHGREN